MVAGASVGRGITIEPVRLGVYAFLKTLIRTATGIRSKRNLARLTAVSTSICAFSYRADGTNAPAITPLHLLSFYHSRKPIRQRVV